MRTFTFDTIADYRQAKYDGVTAGQTPEGVIHAALVGDTSVYSGSVVSKIKTGETFVDSINPFVTPDLGTDGDTLYKITDNGVVKYMYLRKGKTTWDAESFGQVYIDASRLLPSGSTSYSLVTNQSQTFTFADTKTEATGSGRARIAKIKGNSLGWNQKFPGWRNGNKAISTSVSKTLDQAINYGTIGHKYLFAFDYWGSGFSGSALLRILQESVGSSIELAVTNSKAYYSCVYTCARVDTLNVIVVVNGGTFYIDNTYQVDLTLLYGPAIDGLTDDQIKAKFESEYPNPYYAYNAGSLLNFKGTGVKVVGFNQWDEEWEKGRINPTSGLNDDTTIGLRSKNYIPVFPSTHYYFKKGSAGDVLFAVFYDANKAVISYVQAQNSIRQTPSNCAYVRFYIPTSAEVTSYANDICINLSGPRNGQYEPYKSSIIPINITSLRDKATHNLIFPNGLLSAGSVYDEIDLVRRKAIKRVGRVDLGTLNYIKQTTGSGTADGTTPFFRTTINDMVRGTSNVISSKYIHSNSGDMRFNTIEWSTARQINFWNSAYFSSDAETFKTAMNGVYLNYELATPVEYDLSIPLFGTYPADEYVTKQLLPINGETPTTSPMSIEIQQL